MFKKVSVILSLISIINTVQCYSCDPNTCKLPDCLCPSHLPPGGIDPKDAPQFVLISYDDAVNDSTFGIIKNMYKGLAHSNGCPVVATHFLQNQYTNYHYVQQLYSQGDEIALHTFYHTELASQKEIESGKTVISTFAGIPETEIKGFRAPFLKYNNELLQSIQNLKLLYDSSTSSVREDTTWPYTLDNGVSDEFDCQALNICGSITNHNGIWEIPLYSTFYTNNNPPVSMDPPYDDGALLDVLKTNFNNRYNGNRQPMAIAVHAIHCNEPEAKVSLYRNFIKWALSQKDVYFVTYSQLIEYMKNPVKASELSGHPAISCSKFNTYTVNGNEICDGIDNNSDGNIDEGLVENCGIGNTYFSTCFGCPTSEPSVDNPSPSRNGNRILVPSMGCTEGTWDPITSSCVSTTGSTYLDTTTSEKVVTEDNINNGGDNNKSGSLSSFIPTSIINISLVTILISYIINFF
ncbi:hypothetical protein BCR36DRAFT_586224 [Piromyces finnis]|uniref:NodB homology domain-containing protein n=1 Tax=Piromyces finnis TaxID=1754191 RepID=A0A1Y1V0D4_9FUNG|nr:hypothetical protein BCR36DRAFT_586224 [Piromyces finnis]|eukprot:ORX44366.1 hypothetical protein BCR36DRAFT_586224 [Piromyces finnis]